MHQRQVHALAGPGNWRGRGCGLGESGSSSHGGAQTIPKCQRRTCGINLEPMQCSPGEASSEWEATSRRAAYREPNPCGSGQQGTNWLHIITVSEWSDGWPGRIPYPYKQACQQPRVSVHGTFAIWPEYPICSQIDRLSNVGPRFDRAALACLNDSLASSVERLTTQYAREASGSKQQSTASSPMMMASLDVSECRLRSAQAVSLGRARPGQARPGQVMSCRTNNLETSQGRPGGSGQDAASNHGLNQPPTSNLPPLPRSSTSPSSAGQHTPYASRAKEF